MPSAEYPKPMRRVLVRYALRGCASRWYIGCYCIDAGEPGVWYLDGMSNWVGARAITEWQELPE